MALNDDTQRKIKEIFGEMLDLMNVIEVEPDNDVNEEMLEYVEWMKVKLELRYGTVNEDGNFEKRNYPTFPLIHSGIY